MDDLLEPAAVGLAVEPVGFQPSAGDLAIAFRLSLGQGEILARLHAQKIVPFSDLIAIYKNFETVSSQMYRLRRKLARYNVEILTLRSAGYYITNADKAKINSTLSEAG